MLAALQPFLQPGLGILFQLADLQPVQLRLQPGQHRGAAGVQAGIQVDGGDHRLQGVGQDRITAVAARLHLARAELEHGPDIEPAGDPGQGGFAYQFGPGPGQRALVGARPALEQHLGHHQPQQGVAEELQPLVVRRPGAAMGQRPGQQARVGKAMAERIS